MLEKLYASKTEKDLKSTLNLYYALLIVSIVMPILFNAFSYYADGKIHLTKSMIFILIIIWSLFNIDYLKNRIKDKDNAKP
jgi:FtsH-binding integral membrane protein